LELFEDECRLSFLKSACLYDLKNMPEESYRQLIDGTRLAIQQKKESEEKAEADRIAREKADAEERERMRLENERLRKDEEEKERLLKKEREETAKREAEQRAIVEAREKKLKAEQDLKLKKEREERERLEAELKAKTEAEAKEKKRIEAEERAAERAPDRKKLEVFALSIEGLVLPEMKSKEAKKIVEDAKSLLFKTAVYVRGQMKNL